MTDHLTASKRMTELLSQYTNALAIRNIAAWGEYDVERARDQLLTSIAEIEQCAEKADALYDCGTSSCLCGGLLESLHGGQHTNGPCQCTPMQLRQAVHLARQRAEKWKEVGVAYQKWRDAHYDCAPHQPFATSENRAIAEDARDRLDAAITALGDEWGEAVR